MFFYVPICLDKEQVLEGVPLPSLACRAVRRVKVWGVFIHMHTNTGCAYGISYGTDVMNVWHAV